MPQGTVKDFEITTKTGTIVTDAQVELPIDRETFVDSGLIELRLGQRVRFEIDEDDGDQRVRELRLISI